MDRTHPCGGCNVGSIPTRSTRNEDTACAVSSFTSCWPELCFVSRRNGRGRAVKIRERRRTNYSWPQVLECLGSKTAPVVQWIGHSPPKGEMQVRFLPRAPMLRRREALLACALGGKRLHAFRQESKGAALIREHANPRAGVAKNPARRSRIYS